MAGRKTSKGLGSKLSALFTFVILLFAITVVLQLPFALLYEANIVSYNSLAFFSSAALSMGFSLSAVAYLYFFGKMGTKKIVKSLGLSRKMLSVRMLGIGVMVFLAILALELIVDVASTITNVQISTGVDQLLLGAPLWFLVFSTVIAPINEEVLFRGLMVPRIGTILSAAAFALPHITYNSTFGIEIVSAFIFGLIAGYVFKRTKSLYPPIIAHILVNSLAVLATFSILMVV